MYSLLEKNYLITLELIECFYKTSNNNTFSFFSSTLSIDPRTLNKILFDLDYDIQNSGLRDQLTLGISEREIHVQFSPEFSLESVYTFYMTKSICVDLCLLIFNNEYTSIEQFADRYYISRTTLYRKLKPLKDKLKEFNLSLNLSSKELIMGEEKQIRYFFYLLFWEGLGSTDYFSLDYAQPIKDLVHTLLPSLDVHFIFYLSLGTHLSIAFTRIQHNYFLKKELADFEFPSIDFTFEQFNKVISPTYREVTDLSQKEMTNEIRLLHFFIVTSNVYPISKTKKSKMDTINFENPNNQYAQKWINHFTSFYEARLNSDEYFYLLINLIYSQIKFSFLSGGNPYLGIGYGSTILMASYPQHYKKFEKFLTFLKSQGENYQFEDYQKFQYFLLVRDLVKKLAPPFEIIVVSKVSEVEREWIQNWIVKRTNIPIEFKKIMTDDISLVVSDYPIDQTRLKVEKKKYFHWVSYPSETEWKELITKIEKVYYESIF